MSAWTSCGLAILSLPPGLTQKRRENSYRPIRKLSAPTHLSQHARNCTRQRMLMNVASTQVFQTLKAGGDTVTMSYVCKRSWTATSQRSLIVSTSVRLKSSNSTYAMQPDNQTAMATASPHHCNPQSHKLGGVRGTQPHDKSRLPASAPENNPSGTCTRLRLYSGTESVPYTCGHATHFCRQFRSIEPATACELVVCSTHKRWRAAK